MTALRLAMFVPAPVISLSNDELILDKKFVDGMNSHLTHWNGQIDCFMRKGATQIAFGDAYRVRDLDFSVSVMAAHEQPRVERLRTYNVAMLSGDNDIDLLAAKTIRSADCPIVYAIEYTHGTRQTINRLETPSIARKVVRAGRIGVKEFRRRNAFAASAGIQANGYPAYESYAKLNASTMMYLDNRATSDLMATDDDIALRKRRLLSGEPLRLVHSGRLEPMKGSHQLIPLAAALRSAGMHFKLDIYGAGSLREVMAAEIVSNGLADRVELHGPLDYRTELVPLIRRNADLFISCHLQSDPSCTYLETLACGVPIIGYSNKMWSKLSDESGGGWVVPTGSIATMTDAIRRLNNDRVEIVSASVKGLAFARDHDFDSQFKRRMDHLADTAKDRVT